MSWKTSPECYSSCTSGSVLHPLSWPRYLSTITMSAQRLWLHVKTPHVIVTERALLPIIPLLLLLQLPPLPQLILQAVVIAPLAKPPTTALRHAHHHH